MPNFIKIGEGPGKKVSELAWNYPYNNRPLQLLTLVFCLFAGLLNRPSSRNAMRTSQAMNGNESAVSATSTLKIPRTLKMSPG
jgi:hypothetical protein